MYNPLPPLRNDIEVMPSPAPEQPGLLIRDPYRYSETILIIPPVLMPALAFLDGQKSPLELQDFLTRRIGQIVPSQVVHDLVKTLDDQGFLRTEKFEAMRQARRSVFRDCSERHPAHAGTGYPADSESLRHQFMEYMTGADGHKDAPELTAIAAPHVSLFGGWKSYARAYARLTPNLAEKTFVILGTSHYGEPEKFGLTRKPFITPMGSLQTDTTLVDWLEQRAPNSILMEDYCHSIEHSIEFQCLFLQHILGPQLRVLPILCGPFLQALLTGEAPESHEGVRRFFDALGELAALKASRLFWVLGIDLTHIGRRYGDDFAAVADRGRMAEVQQQDRARLDRICEGDRSGFLELVTPQRDALRWCGFAPLYTFLKVVPGVRANVLKYEQWNIDEESVVSFAAMEFFRKA
ncbi:MAG: AmmeMemoRadiSam system protein B [Acidobacteria bacterium]|nr:AmmeMemoRadiSam system protein B [Acidobacteriota bacterium]